MNKQEIAETLRKEVGEMELAIKKSQARVERLKQFVLALEDELGGPKRIEDVPDSKFRKVIDSVFGENPTKPKR